MAENNVEDLHYYRVCKAVGLDPNTIIEGSAAEAIEASRKERLRELASAIEVSLDDAEEVVRNLKGLVVETDDDEREANNNIPRHLLFSRNIPIFEELLSQDPEHPWSISYGTFITFINRPLAFSRCRGAAVDFECAKSLNDIAGAVKALIKANALWERLLSVCTSRDMEAMSSLVDEMPEFEDIGSKLRDLQFVLNDLKAAASKEDRVLVEYMGSLRGVCPERF
ncbi:hypothetical protein [Agrobacterium pusense]|uniref:hypothetical protein n=1 Tax=Agrobacterium pusense TaxID=648995 RepID=UPI000D34FFC0|nr:hypothetical protein [Agrobacterium pusense]PTV70206.1 hypothetical protein DBL06_25415 [Agrobacterium pusense]